MRNLKIVAAVVVAAVAVGLIATIAFASAYNPYRTMTPVNGFFGSMMGSYPTATPNTQAAPNQYVGGWGCRGRGTVTGYAATQAPATNVSVTLAQATSDAQQYVALLNDPDLKVTQVEEYTNNYYVLVTEKSTGNGAFELLVDKYSGAVVPEMGPNMMWNTKYTATTGMMGVFNGMCGMMGWQHTANTPMTVTLEQAKADAQQYLTANIAGATVGDVTTFSGYYTVEVLQNGSPYGMLSVNGYSGQVWFHSWHGAFIQEADVP